MSDKEQQGTPAQKNQKDQPHAGHRERLRDHFLESGVTGMPDHMILELLLFYAIPRIDTNVIAHNLINRFGSISRVFDASADELMQVDGIGKGAAVLIKFISALQGRYALDKFRPGMDFTSLKKAAELFSDLFSSRSEECIYALLLDNGNCLISLELLHIGTVNSSTVNPRKIAEVAFKKNAASLILAHNHPSGDSAPSRDDLSTTRHLLDALIPIDLTLRAHFVFGRNTYTDILPVLYDEGRLYAPKYIVVSAGERQQPPPSEPDPIPEEDTEQNEK